jgi:hypothetical protein
MIAAKRFGLGTLVAMLLLSFALLAPGGAVAQSVTIDPGAASAGSTVTATGSGWASGISVRIEWPDGTVLDDVVVDASGEFTAELEIPATATPDDYDIRFIGYVPPYVADCTVDVVTLTFTVLEDGATATTTATAIATATEEPIGTTEPTIVATQCATATNPTETVTGTTTAEPTETAATQTTTSTTTATATSPATATATRTPTVLATATRTPTVPATATRTPTKVATKAPTKIVYPGTGSAGLLDQDDDDNGSSTPLIVAVAVLGAGLTSAGVVMYRRRMV